MKNYRLFRDNDGNLPPKIVNEYSNTLSKAQELYELSIDRVPIKYRVSEVVMFNNIIKEIFKIAERDLLDNDGGVVLDKIGYFCHWMTPKKTTYYSRHTGKLHTNLFTGGYWYNSAMFPWVFRQNYFMGWSMESCFNRRFVYKFYNKLKQGKRYRIFVKLISSLYKGDINYSRKKYQRINKLKKKKHDYRNVHS